MICLLNFSALLVHGFGVNQSTNLVVMWVLLVLVEVFVSFAASNKSSVQSTFSTRPTNKPYVFQEEFSLYYASTLWGIVGMGIGSISYL